MFINAGNVVRVPPLKRKASRYKPKVLRKPKPTVTSKYSRVNLTNQSTLQPTISATSKPMESTLATTTVGM